jgi:hypothetical protein
MSNDDFVVYCHGDSFVIGSELGDYLITSYPGYCNYDEKSTEKFRTLNIWYSESYQTNSSVNLERKKNDLNIHNKNIELSFPSVIQKKTNFNVINASIHYLGTSQDCIVRRSITDLYELSKKYKKIIAIIATTSANRIELPQNESWKNYMLTNLPLAINHYENMIAEVIKFYNYYATEYHLLVNWYKNILLLKQFCQTHNIKLFLTTGIPNVDYITTESDDLLNLREMVNLSYDVNLDIVAQEINKDVMCPGHHFSPIVHEKAADIFIDLIYKELNQ